MIRFPCTQSEGACLEKDAGKAGPVRMVVSETIDEIPASGGIWSSTWYRVRVGDGVRVVVSDCVRVENLS